MIRVTINSDCDKPDKGDSMTLDFSRELAIKEIGDMLRNKASIEYVHAIRNQMGNRFKMHREGKINGKRK